MSRTDCAFDPQGNLLWSDDGHGRTAYAYDAAGRLAAAVYPDGSCLELRYDAAGNVAERRSPGRAHERFTYDTGGRMTAARLGAGTTMAYDYDQDGRLLEARAPGCVTRYAYDEAGRPVRREQTIEGITYLAEFAYNADGHLIGARAPGLDAWLRYAYDEQRRLVALGYDDAPELVRLAYDSDGRRVVIGYAGGATQSFELDARYQVRRVQLAAPDGAALLDLRYRAGQAGNIVAIGDERYAYDERGRLVSHGPLLGARTTYRYDEAGNRLELRRPGGLTYAYRYDSACRLTCVERADGAKTRYGYDGEGNLFARSDARGAWSYRYDAAGRLVRVERDRRTIAAYGYDHTGRRVLKRAAAGTTITHRDPWGNRMAETLLGGETRVYLGPAGQHLACLVVCEGRVSARFLHPDHLGSLRAVTDQQGRLLARYDFDPFGSPLPAAPDAGWEPVFAGHPFDSALGFYDCATRLYDPEVGRFISADNYTFSADDPRLLWLQAPAEARRALRDQRLQAWQREGVCRNRYVYALNNPLTYVDRDGHSAGLYFLYTLAAIFWALPYTLVGFLFFEVFLNWITFAWLWDWGKHRWEGHSSDRLSAWSWWVLGGLSGKLVVGGGAFTLGNFVIANADFMDGLDKTTQNFGIPTKHSELVAPVDTSKLFNDHDAVVEHELRHTNQYGWWGPFMMPWVLVLYFLFQNLILQLFSAITKKDVYAHWGDIWKKLTGSWWQILLSSVGVLLLPGAYWWDYIGRGGYASSWFEQNAAQYSGSAKGQDVRASASADSVAVNGTAIVSVISRESRVGALSLTVSTNSSSAPAPVDITPPQITNLKVFRYTAGPNKGTDTLTAGDGSSNFTLEIEVT